METLTAQLARLNQITYARQLADLALAACNRGIGQRDRAASAQQARDPQQARAAADLALACAEEAQRAADDAAALVPLAMGESWPVEQHAANAADCARLARHHAAHAEESARIAAMLGERGAPLAEEAREARRADFAQHMIAAFEEELAAATAPQEEEEIHTQELNRAADAILRAAADLVTVGAMLATTDPARGAGLVELYSEACANQRRAEEALHRATLAAWRHDLGTQTSQSIAAQQYAARVAAAALAAQQTTE